MPELGEGYPDGAPLLSLLAVPSALAQEEAEHLADGGASVPAAFPLEVGARSLALLRLWQCVQGRVSAPTVPVLALFMHARKPTSAAPVPACVL